MRRTMFVTNILLWLACGCFSVVPFPSAWPQGPWATQTPGGDRQGGEGRAAVKPGEDVGTISGAGSGSMEKRGRQKPSYNWYLGLLPGPGLGKRTDKKEQARQEGKGVGWDNSLFYTRGEQGGGNKSEDSTQDWNPLRIRDEAQYITGKRKQRRIPSGQQRLVQKRSGRHSAIRVVFHRAK